MSPIESHLSDLGRALRGPRKARVDLLAEVRDGLHDAAEAYQRQGMGRAEAELRAVADFGAVADVAPAFQTELGYAQTSRTGLLVSLVLAPQGLVWAASGVLFDSIRVGAPAPGFDPLNEMMSWLGGFALAGSILAVLACGAGLRYTGVRRGLAPAMGVFALVVAAVFTTSGILLTVLGTAPLWSVGGLPWLTTVLVAPMLLVAASGRRCLAASVRPGSGATPAR